MLRNSSPISFSLKGLFRNCLLGSGSLPPPADITHLSLTGEVAALTTDREVNHVIHDQLNTAVEDHLSRRLPSGGTRRQRQDPSIIAPAKRGDTQCAMISDDRTR